MKTFMVETSHSLNVTLVLRSVTLYIILTDNLTLQ